jgi:hypothetical protein
VHNRKCPSFRRKVATPQPSALIGWEQIFFCREKESRYEETIPN